MQECDLLIAVGARFDDRVTGKLNTFAPNASVIHMDIDPAEMNKLRQAHVALQGDLNSLLSGITATAEDRRMASVLCRAARRTRLAL
ncbi:acetolactate synthase large subunit [Salmonella enterica subsp. enterica]|uniref:Acetolactate synthase large subunit n=1 Tax=Salmonella enterica I TaxID=59201 RepID=A0A3S5DM90_SALET|nr:acetolactate synthase large subunit [Salmonella enterica subsp. enterica]